MLIVASTAINLQFYL